MLKATLAALITALLAAMPGAYAVKGAVVLPMVQCRYEDGSGAQSFPCVWDADTRGNGKGRSYVLTSKTAAPVFVR